MQQHNDWLPDYRVTNYKVKPGDTLYLIAKRFKTHISAIKKINKLKSNILFVGQYLKIPPTLPDGIYVIGSTGPSVKKLQEVLSFIGFDVNNDGYYGPVTSKIIKGLQQKFPEIVIDDGVYGPKTKKIIDNLLSVNYEIVRNPESRTVLVNKLNALNPDYVPKNLIVPEIPFSFTEFRPQKLMRADAANALEALFAKAKQEGIELNAISGYRSYEYQHKLFSRNIKANPKANLFSSRPGESEHQTGLAIDISSPSVDNRLVQSLGETKEGKWLEANAPEFGFIIRFPKEKENITRYRYEPWHIRYVGKDVAKRIMDNNLTLEEYLGKVNN
ncbi:MAG: carboxypeptidase [Bacillales bacterium]|jgi:LAS superfamily LD-carboxypeptidase LdcB|nr:carboxypeptidase [Bacillales bacterium]